MSENLYVVDYHEVGDMDYTTDLFKAVELYRYAREVAKYDKLTLSMRQVPDGTSDGEMMGLASDSVQSGDWTGWTQLMSYESEDWSAYERGRLEYLRSQIDAERISYGEIVELQGLADFIAPGDVQLLEWAGVPEFKD